MSKEALGSALLSSWHPLVSSEQLTAKRLSEAMDYWNILLPLSQRMSELEAARELQEKTLSVSDLIRLKFLSERIFNEEVSKLQDELADATSAGPIDYWKFVVRESYEDSVMRAYALSFLISTDLRPIHKPCRRNDDDRILGLEWWEERGKIGSDIHQLSEMERIAWCNT